MVWEVGKDKPVISDTPRHPWAGYPLGPLYPLGKSLGCVLCASVLCASAGLGCALGWAGVASGVLGWAGLCAVCCVLWAVCLGGAGLACAAHRVLVRHRRLPRSGLRRGGVGFYNIFIS